MKRASCGDRKQDQQQRQRGSAQEQAHAEEHIGDGTGRALPSLQLVMMVSSSGLITTIYQ
jgi:hypothetical protein